MYIYKYICNLHCLINELLTHLRMVFHGRYHLFSCKVIRFIFPPLSFFYSTFFYLIKQAFNIGCMDSSILRDSNKCIQFVDTLNMCREIVLGLSTRLLNGPNNWTLLRNTCFYSSVQNYWTPLTTLLFASNGMERLRPIQPHHKKVS